MKNFRYIVSLLKAFFVRFKWILLIGIVLGVTFFLLFNVFGLSVFNKPSLRTGIVGRYRLDNIPDYVLSHVSQGLTEVDENGEINPAVAKSWEESESGKTWTFHIDENLKWQDGKKITSNDIKINYSDVTVEKPDSKTIVFKLETPFSPFPIVVSKPIFKKGFMGTGEWEVKKVTVNGNIVEQIRLTKKNEMDMVFKFYPTEERAKLALKLGAVDKLTDIFNPEPFDTWKTLAIEKNIDYDRFAAVFFNTEEKKPTADKSLRQALTYAINKNQFPGIRALSPISPDSWAYNPQVKPYSFDTERAKELLKEVPKNVIGGLTFNIATTPVLLKEAEKIANNWSDLGIIVSVQVISTIPQDFDSFLAVVDIPKDPDQYSLWHSRQDASNISNYKNTRIDKLLEDGRTLINLSERKKIYLDFQRFLVEDSPAAFLYHPESYTISRK